MNHPLINEEQLNQVLFAGDVSLEKLRTRRNLMSVEAKSGNVLDRLVGFTKDFSTYVDGTFDKMRFAFVKSSDLRSIIRVSSSMSYTAIANVNVPKPAGMKVTYLKYLDVLEKHIDDICDIEDKVLDPLEKLVMLYMGDYSHAMRPRSHNIEFLNVDGIRRDLKPVVDLGDTSGTDKYGNLIERNSDWGRIIKIVDDLQDKITKVNPVRIQTRVAKLADRMEVLVTRLEELKLKDEVPTKTVSELAEMTYKVGESVEMFAAFAYLVKTTSVAIEKTTEVLKER